MPQRRPNALLHYQLDPHATLTTSEIGAERLIEAARARHSVIVHASTSEVYGDPTVHPQPESYWGKVNLARQVVELAAADVPIVLRRLPADDPKRRCPDITNARALLDFEPRIDLRRGLELTIADFRRRMGEGPVERPDAGPTA